MVSSQLKTPPFSQEAEDGVLGSVLLDPEVLYNIDLKPESFYDPRNQKLFSEITQLASQGKPIDAISIHDHLKREGGLDRVGGFERLLELQDNAGTPAHSKHYADIVAGKHLCRQEIEALSDGLRLAYEGESASDGVINSLMNIEERDDGDTRDLHLIGEEFIEDCKKGEVGHLEWWCPEWTNKLGRLSSELIVLHAPRSTGKTAMMLQWITESHSKGQCTPLASIEMMKKSLVPRFIANIGRVSTFRMKSRGQITTNEEQKSREAVEKIRSLNFCIHDKKMSIDDICKFAIRESRKRKIHAIWIDNLLCINDGGRQYPSKTLMYDDFIKRLRDLRDILEIPIIILAHPNENGGIAWSKDVENIADVILFLGEVSSDGTEIRGTDKKVYRRTDISGKHVLARFQKARDGISPTASLNFIGDTQTFEHLNWED